MVIQVVTFTDCRPLHLYWQVEPDPGTQAPCPSFSQLKIQGLTLVRRFVLTSPRPAHRPRCTQHRHRYYAHWAAHAELDVGSKVFPGVSAYHSFIPRPTAHRSYSLLTLDSKLRLIALFSLGVFLVIITIVRLPINFSHGFQQVNRTTWASVSHTTSKCSNMRLKLTSHLRRLNPSLPRLSRISLPSTHSVNQLLSLWILQP